MKSTDKLILTLLLLMTCVRMTAAIDGDRVFRPIKVSDGLADNSAQAIKCTYSGRMTIATIGNISFYDGGNFMSISNDSESKYKLEDYRGHYHLYYDNNHHLWLKNKREVSCVNLNTERFHTNIDSIFATYGVTKRIDDMFVDADGELWLCIDKMLSCNKYDYKIALHKTLNLQDMEVYDKKLLMLFYEDGSMTAYDAKNGKQLYQNRLYPQEDIERFGSSGVLLMHENGLFVIRNGHKDGILLHYDIGKREWSEVMRSERHMNSMVVHDGKLYVATECGYFTYHLSTHEVVYYQTLTMQDGSQQDTDINTIEFDRQGGMWLGTERRGVLYGPPLHAPFQILSWENPQALKYIEMMADLNGIYEFKGKRANVMLVDSRHWTWVGTKNGIYLYMTPQSEPIVYTRRNGLLNAVIHAVIEDDMGNIWLSTSYGITCMYIVDNKVKQVFSFSDYDNVPNETFIDAKALKLADGSIVMQALDHVVKFNPKNFLSLFNQETYIMYPKLTRLMINGINVSAGSEFDGDVILERAVSRTRELNLNYNLNSVSMTFSALNFARPLQTYYRVRVREISKEWTEHSYFSGTGMVDRKGLLHLPMLALKPGTYHIEVQSSVVPGKYVGEPMEWTININEPWWRASIVIVIFSLILLTMAVLNFIVYNRNTRKRIRRNNEEGDVIRRIMAFVERCNGYSSEPLMPSQEEIYGNDMELQVELSNECIDVLLKVITFVSERKGRPFSMHALSTACDMDLNSLYELLSQNMHKSPRALIRSVRLDQVAELLRTTDLTIEQVAIKAGFVSPNYMIAKFYHKFRMTPSEYREELAQ